LSAFLIKIGVFLRLSAGLGATSESSDEVECLLMILDSSAVGRGAAGSGFGVGVSATGRTGSVFRRTRGPEAAGAALSRITAVLTRRAFKDRSGRCGRAALGRVFPFSAS